MTVGPAAREPAPLHPLVARLADEFGFERPDLAGFDTAVAAPGHLILFFSEDPVQYKETLDLAVILPELVEAFPGRFRAAVLLPDVARAIAPRYGFRRWPAFVMLRDGEYVGAIDGIRDWSDYCTEVARLLEIEPSEPPTGTPVQH